MKKIHFNLNTSANIHTGMGVYSNEIMKRIVMNNEYLYEGGVNFNIKNKKNLNMFLFPIHISIFPYRWVFKKKINGISYNHVMRSKADCFIFWANTMPKCKIKGKVITVVHDVRPLYFEKENPLKASVFRNNVQEVVDRSDCIVTVSQNAKAEIVKYFHCDESKIEVVFNGVNINKFRTTVDAERIKHVQKKYNLPSQYILYFGGTMKHKNIINMLEAYSLLPLEIKQQHKFVIANSADYIIQRIEDLNLKDFVILLNGVEEEDKAVVYKLASLKLFVSKYEGFGIPVIEAMAAGTPVITSNVSSLPEVAGGAAVLVNPDNPQDIRDAIIRILSEPEFRTKLIEKGYENIKKYTWDKSAEQFIQIIRKLIG